MLISLQKIKNGCINLQKVVDKPNRKTLFAAFNLLGVSFQRVLQVVVIPVSNISFTPSARSTCWSFTAKSSVIIVIITTISVIFCSEDVVRDFRRNLMIIHHWAVNKHLSWLVRITQLFVII